MKYENTLTSNWKNAFRGLRNPMNSWSKSDSYGQLCKKTGDEDLDAVNNWMKKIDPSIKEDSPEWSQALEELHEWLNKNAVIQINHATDVVELFFIGPNDMDLAQRMIAAGSPNDKFLRQIFVSVDITAPLYWWREMDTYKIGTTTNSSSTMHKIASTPITIDCFETDDLELINLVGFNVPGQDSFILNPHWFITYCEELRKKYLETKDIKYWKELIRWLPNGWLQTRTWTANYNVLRNIYRWRKDHKLVEWHHFCKWIESLPYAEDLIVYKNGN